MWILAALALCVASASALSLDGAWRLRNSTRGTDVAAVVPGGVYTDLHKNNILDQDFFHRFNDEDYRWVSKYDWTYYREFQVPAGDLSKTNQVLVFHGVDTVADIVLNGQLLGSVDNMFIRHRFNVKSILKADGNQLEVRFSSPVRVAAERAKLQAASYVVPPSCLPDAYRGECGANHLRKMQASFAWDWGPAFPSMGLWKSVELESYDGAVVRDLSFSVSRNALNWQATASIYWETGFSDTPTPVALELALRRQGVQAYLYKSNITLRPGSGGLGKEELAVSLKLSDVETWWPNGMGAQSLYDLTVSLTHSSGEVQSRAVRVGFRTVELIQDPVLDNDRSKGLTFYFRVNGQPMFAKGSNWIPAHVLPELGADPSVVQHLLRSAKETNMNMLRVWGGGVYESDLFYQTADELGILIWQDFMFACAMYPTGDQFLASVRTEVQQQYRRLNHHASVAIWAANNENEAALRGNWYGTASNFSLYAKDYVKLYVDTVRDTIQRENSGATFLVSSPSNGAASSESVGYIAENPYSPLFGDDHHYDYVSDGWNPSVFHHTRFGSEYGFQSLPSLVSLKSVGLAEDLAMGSRFSDSRQHHPDGNQEILLQIERHLPLPENVNGTDAYPTIVYFSQINQAMSTKTETEFLRRSRSLLTPGGEGRTMGALYWQLNDVWQAPSWSSIDFSGRWKVLHYFAQDFFAPILISPHLSQDGTVHLDVVSDVDSSERHTARVVVQRWDSFTSRHEETMSFVLNGAGTTSVWSSPLQSLLSQAQCTASDCFLLFSLFRTSDSSPVGPQNFLLLAPPKSSHLQGTTFKVESVSGPEAGTQHQAHDFRVVFTASSPALFVWLEAGTLTGRFSRNGFLMSQSEEVVLFHTDESVSAAELGAALTVTAVNEGGSRYPIPSGSAPASMPRTALLLLPIACATLRMLLAAL